MKKAIAILEHCISIEKEVCEKATAMLNITKARPARQRFEEQMFSALSTMEELEKAVEKLKK